MASEKNCGTFWSMDMQFHRYPLSPQWQNYDQLIRGAVSDFDAAFAEAGYEWIDWIAELDDFHLSFRAARHRGTGDLFVEMSNAERCLARVHVLARDADAFLVTEYASMLQRALAVRQGIAAGLIEKAAIAFIRHGHGTSTISEWGDTKEEQEQERERLQALHARRQREAGSQAAP